MYNPISLNVIRQAIAWHTDVQPFRIRQSWQQLWPNGSVTTIYHLLFNASQVIHELNLRTTVTGPDIMPFATLIDQSFCDDCRVIEQLHYKDTDTIQITLYTYFPRKDKGKPRWKQ